MAKIKLGDKVKDKITGYTGIAECYTDYLAGCRRFAVRSQELHEGKLIEAQWFDEPQLEVVEEEVIEEPEEPNEKESGGPAYLTPPEKKGY